LIPAPIIFAARPREERRKDAWKVDEKKRQLSA
jgi:hypothetical protein